MRVVWLDNAVNHCSKLLQNCRKLTAANYCTNYRKLTARMRTKSED